MKLRLEFVLFWMLFFLSHQAFSQNYTSKDTLINMGTYEINFSIIKGEGVPILFESGASNDGTIWEPLLEDIYAITGATLITYDRAGFGKSGINSSKHLEDHGIMSGVLDLERGLNELGYDKGIMLVSHSYGGYFTYLYSSRNPEKVKTIVGIDIVHDYHAEGFGKRLVDRMDGQIKKWEATNKGMYYLLSTLEEASSLITTIEIPSEIPVVDIMMSSSFGIDKEESERWVNCHKQFWDSHPNTEGIYAEQTGHYIWHDNPSLIINTIVKAYGDYTNSEDRLDIYKRGLDYAQEASNLSRKNSYSEESINLWGYQNLEKGELGKALGIFELNTKLYPESFNVYDSYGEGLLKANQKEEALKMYKKSVLLNPENENGIQMIEQIEKKE